VLATDLATTKSLEQALSRSANQELESSVQGRTWRTSFFNRRPSSNAKWLVLVDGLDEVLSADHRQRLLRTVANSSANATYRFVVAARSLAHQDRVWQWKPVTYEMRPLNDDELLAFARRWFTAFEVEDPDTMATEFTAAIEHVGIDRSLARNPLMATMLCQIYRRRRGTALPASRYEIYDEFVNVMYERMPGDPSQPTNINEQMSRALGVWGDRAVERGALLLERLPNTVLELAYNQESHKASTGRQLLDALETRTRQLRKNVDGRTWRRLLVDTSQRTGLLSRHRDEGLRFVHDTFSDFLAARYVAEHPLLHKMVLRRLFGRFGFANPETAPPFGKAGSSHTSFVRFLFGAAEQREWTENALRRLVSRRGLKGLMGAEFAATLHADGVLPESVRKAAITALRTRTSGSGNRHDRNHAERLLVRLGSTEHA
jgi:GTP diphosphokinase / guanosine-3',5'-bis(diphosphate) 3'-diphosphatase